MVVTVRPPGSVVVVVTGVPGLVVKELWLEFWLEFRPELVVEFWSEVCVVLPAVLPLP